MYLSYVLSLSYDVILCDNENDFENILFLFINLREQLSMVSCLKWVRGVEMHFVALMWIRCGNDLYKYPFDHENATFLFFYHFSIQ